MSRVAFYHEALKSEYFDALLTLVTELKAGNCDISNQDITRHSLRVGLPTRKKFLYVGLHGFYWVTSFDKFNCMARVLKKNFSMRGGNKQTAWKLHLGVFFIIAIASFVTLAVTRRCLELRHTTLTSSMPWDLQKWRAYMTQQAPDYREGR